MLMKLRLAGGCCVNAEKLPNQFRGPATRHATLRGDTEIGHVPGCGFDPFLGRFNAIAMNQPQEDFRYGRERQLSERLKIAFIRPVDRDRHMDVRNGPLYRGGEEV